MYKKCLLILFISLSLNTVHAEWKKIGQNVNGDTYYLDFTRVEESKMFDYIIYYVLADYKNPLMGDFLSLESTIAVDCAIGKQLDIGSIYYAESMGRGYGIEAPPTLETEWISPPPNSVMDVLMKKICRTYY